MAEKSRVLIIGGTGLIGKFIVEASVNQGHPTFAMVRECSASDPAKANLLAGFKNSGVSLLHTSITPRLGMVDQHLEQEGLRARGEEDKLDAPKAHIPKVHAGNIKFSQKSISLEVTSTHKPMLVANASSLHFPT